MRNEKVFSEDEVYKASTVLCNINDNIKEIAKSYKSYAMAAFNEFKEVMYIVKKR